MKTREVKIEKVVLTIGDKEIELSLTEAEELREILNKTFGKQTVIASPIVIERDRYVRPWWEYQPWATITWSTSGTTRPDGQQWTIGYSDINSTLALGVGQ